MKKYKGKVVALLLCLILSVPKPARADMWGGDIPLLIEIVTNTLQQITQLRNILGNARESLNYIQDINRGIREAMRIIRTANSGLNPGVLSDIDNLGQLVGVVEQLYGRVPQTPEARMQRTTDQSVAEAIHLHNEAFRYAKTIDPEAERIKDYARVASPQTAEKLTAQSLGVLIHVMNQILRTNAALLKLQSEQLALSNKKEKLNSEHFKMQYEGLSRAFSELKPSYTLPKLGN